MKARTKILILILADALLPAIMPKQISAQQFDISYQVFYDELSPYGQWMDNPAYGYVWVPDVPDFVPYSTAGHWIMTEYGWAWLSDYNWGWAPFHYGRWDYDDYVGWFWVPDTEWGPSWVVWRRAEGYYGWAPMQPGISLNVYFGNDYNMHNDHWMFVRDRDFQRTNLNRYYADRSVSQRIIVNSTAINTTYIDNRRHTTYVSGPTSNDVQRNTGKTVNRVEVQEYNKPGERLNKGQLQIYRPEVVKNSENGPRPIPTRIADKQDVRQHSGRNINTQQSNTIPKNTNARQQQQQQGKQEMELQQQRQKQKIDRKQPQQKQQDQRKQQQDQQMQKQRQQDRQMQQQNQQMQQQRQQDRQNQQQDQQKQQQDQQKQQQNQQMQQQRQLDRQNQQQDQQKQQQDQQKQQQRQLDRQNQQQDQQKQQQDQQKQQQNQQMQQQRQLDRQNQQQDQQKQQQDQQKQQLDQQKQQQQQRTQPNSVNPRRNNTGTQPAQPNNTQETPKASERKRAKNDETKKPPKGNIN